MTCLAVKQVFRNKAQIAMLRGGRPPKRRAPSTGGMQPRRTRTESFCPDQVVVLWHAPWFPDAPHALNVRMPTADPDEQPRWCIAKIVDNASCVTDKIWHAGRWYRESLYLVRIYLRADRADEQGRWTLSPDSSSVNHVVPESFVAPLVALSVNGLNDEQDLARTPPTQLREQMEGLPPPTSWSRSQSRITACYICGNCSYLRTFLNRKTLSAHNVKVHPHGPSPPSATRADSDDDSLNDPLYICDGLPRPLAQGDEALIWWAPLANPQEIRPYDRCRDRGSFGWHPTCIVQSLGMKKICILGAVYKEHSYLVNSPPNPVSASTETPMTRPLLQLAVQTRYPVSHPTQIIVPGRFLCKVPTNTDTFADLPPPDFWATHDRDTVFWYGNDTVPRVSLGVPACNFHAGQFVMQWWAPWFDTVDSNETAPWNPHARNPGASALVRDPTWHHAQILELIGVQKVRYAGSYYSGPAYRVHGMHHFNGEIDVVPEVFLVDVLDTHFARRPDPPQPTAWLQHVLHPPLPPKGTSPMRTIPQVAQHLVFWAPWFAPNAVPDRPYNVTDYPSWKATRIVEYLDTRLVFYAHSKFQGDAYRVLSPPQYTTSEIVPAVFIADSSMQRGDGPPYVWPGQPDPDVYETSDDELTIHFATEWKHHFWDRMNIDFSATPSVDHAFATLDQLFNIARVCSPRDSLYISTPTLYTRNVDQVGLLTRDQVVCHWRASWFHVEPTPVGAAIGVAPPRWLSSKVLLYLGAIPTTYAGSNYAEDAYLVEGVGDEWHGSEIVPSRYLMPVTTYRLLRSPQLLPPPWWENTWARGVDARHYNVFNPVELNGDEHVPPLTPLTLNLWWAPWFAVHNPPLHLRSHPFWVEVTVISFLGVRAFGYAATEHTTQAYRVKAPSGSLEVVPQTFVRSIDIHVANSGESDRRMHLASLPPPRAWTTATLRAPSSRLDRLTACTACNYATIERALEDSRPDGYAQEIQSSGEQSSSSIATLLHNDDYGGSAQPGASSSSSQVARLLD